MPVFNVSYFRFTHSEFTMMNGDPGQVPEGFKEVFSPIYIFHSENKCRIVQKHYTRQLGWFKSSKPSNPSLALSSTSASSQTNIFERTGVLFCKDEQVQQLEYSQKKKYFAFVFRQTWGSTQHVSCFVNASVCAHLYRPHLNSVVPREMDKIKFSCLLVSKPVIGGGVGEADKRKQQENKETYNLQETFSTRKPLQ